MTRVDWNASGEKYYEAGVQRGVLYPTTGPGVPWNGLLGVTEGSEGGEAKPVYMDGVKIRNRLTPDTEILTLKAFTYPSEFEASDGVSYVMDAIDVTEQKGLSVNGQIRKPFNLSYRTEIGNDVDAISHGYYIHLLYNCLASPTSRDFATLGSGTDASPFTWNITTTPVQVLGRRPTAHFLIDSRKTDAFLLEAFEDILYGTETTAARMPTPVEMIKLFANWLTFTLVDNKDGSWTATGPEGVINMLSQTEFEINWYSVTLTGPDSYTLSSK